MLKKYISGRELNLITNAITYPLEENEKENTISSELKRNIDIALTILKPHSDFDHYLKLIYNIGRFSVSYSQYSHAEELFLKIINAAKEIKGKERISAKSYMGLAEIAVVQAKWKEAASYLNKAANVFKSCGDNTGLGEIENFLGTIFGEKGIIDRAQKHFEKANKLLSSNENTLLINKINANLGIIYTMQGKTSEARQHLESALSFFKEQKLEMQTAEVTHNLGMLCCKEKDYVKAVKYFEQTLGIVAKNPLQPIAGMSYLGLAEAYFNLGEFDKSDKCIKIGMTFSSMINDRLTAADLYKLKGMAELEKNKHENAEIYFLASLRINEELGNEMNYAETSVKLCQFYKRQGLYEKSKSYYSAALKYYSKHKCTKEIEELNKTCLN